MSKYRICAMGNSHLAAAKLGWDEIGGEYPDYEFDFFGFTPGTSTQFGTHIRVEGKSLVAVTNQLQTGFKLTAGGRTRIEGGDYSAFVTFGLGLAGPGFAVRTACMKHRLVEHAEPGSQLFSAACLSATTADLLRSTKAVEPFRAIRKVSDAPIFFHAMPAPMTGIMGDPEHAEDPQTVPGLFSRVRAIFKAKCAEAGAVESYVFLDQPEETIAESGLTKDEYIVDGVGFSAFAGGSKTVNTGHGNRAYGVVVMRRFMEALAGTELAGRPDAPGA